MDFNEDLPDAGQLRELEGMERHQRRKRAGIWEEKLLCSLIVKKTATARDHASAGRGWGEDALPFPTEDALPFATFKSPALHTSLHGLLHYMKFTGELPRGTQLANGQIIPAAS